jgi:hypothetical protein
MVVAVEAAPEDLVVPEDRRLVNLGGAVVEVVVEEPAVPVVTMANPGRVAVYYPEFAESLDRVACRRE